MIIYLITNLINGKQYVGQTIHTVQERWANHLCRKSGCTSLRRAIEKYGKDSFEIHPIDDAETQAELDEKERFWIKELNTLAPKGYNLTSGGDHVIFTEEVKNKIRLANTGRKCSEESKAKISEALRGQWARGERKGHAISDDRRYELAKYVKEHGSWNKGLPKELNHLTGKPKSQATKDKISKSLRKPILCVELDKTYDSAQSASKELGIQFSNISRCLHGRSHTAGGYHWRWIDGV